VPWEKSFNRNGVLSKAMMVFWRRGYDNTAIGDLVKETGASRYGLYDEFDDKAGLFLEALDQYRDTVVKPRLGKLLQKGATRDDLAEYFQKLAAPPKKSFQGLGCMMCDTAVSVAHQNPAAAQKVTEHMALLHRAFLGALTDSHSKPEQTAINQAHFLVGLVQGGAVLSRSGASDDVKSVYYTIGLTALN